LLIRSNEVSSQECIGMWALLMREDFSILECRLLNIYKNFKGACCPHLRDAAVHF